jgi:hypothetical protein
MVEMEESRNLELWKSQIAVFRRLTWMIGPAAVIGKTNFHYMGIIVDTLARYA